MTQDEDLLALLLSRAPLRLNGITYYAQNGKIRSRVSKYKKRTSCSEKMKVASSRFTEARRMWKMYHRAIGDLPMWSIAAREMHAVKSDTLFHSLNGGCFAAGVGVQEFPAFRFAVGSLDMPAVTAVRREGWRLTLEWHVDEDRPSAAWTDEVYIGYFHATLPRTPHLLKLEGISRADARATFDIPSLEQPDDTALHLYLFFGNLACTRFSPSAYVLAER